MPYVEPTFNLPVDDFRWTLTEPNIKVEAIAKVPGGGTFPVDLGTFNRLTEAQSIEDAMEALRVPPPE